MATTKAGVDLAWKLNPAVGTTPAIIETCSLLVAASRSYDRIQERRCNEAMDDATEAKVDQQETALEAVICGLVGKLPHTDHGPIGVLFDGDPRGSTVRLVMPPELAHLHDDWGRSGICVLA